MINYTVNYNKFCMSMKQSSAVMNEYHLQESEKSVQDNRQTWDEQSTWATYVAQYKTLWFT